MVIRVLIPIALNTFSTSLIFLISYISGCWNIRFYCSLICLELCPWCKCVNLRNKIDLHFFFICEVLSVYAVVLCVPFHDHSGLSDEVSKIVLCPLISSALDYIVKITHMSFSLTPYLLCTWIILAANKIVCTINGIKQLVQDNRGEWLAEVGIDWIQVLACDDADKEGIYLWKKVKASIPCRRRKCLVWIFDCIVNSCFIICQGSNNQSIPIMISSSISTITVHAIFQLSLSLSNGMFEVEKLYWKHA